MKRVIEYDLINCKKIEKSIKSEGPDYEKLGANIVIDYVPKENGW